MFSREEMMKFSKSKKAAIEVQIGWIFVLIVGALILLFFVSVIKTTGKASTETKYADLKVRLVGIISQSEADVGTTRTLNLPTTALNFECEGFVIDGSSDDTARHLDYKTFFAPDTIKGREMLTYSKYFEMPYASDYFIYLIPRQERFSFVNNTCTDTICQNFLKTIIKELPVNTTYQTVTSIGDIRDNNNYKERIILFNTDPRISPAKKVHNSLIKTDVTLINIKGTSFGSGKIEYYTNHKNSDSFTNTLNSSYLGFPMLLGAIISEDSLYECNVNKTLLKFKIMTTIYANRTDTLKKHYYTFAPGTYQYKCYQMYNSVSLVTTLQVLSTNPFSNFQSISDTAGDLGITNDKLMTNSCPMIY